MSHVSCGKGRIRDHVTDLQALKLACHELGLELCLGQAEYKWFGNWVNDYSRDDAAYKNGVKPEDYGKCTHAIRVKWTPEEEIQYGRHPNERPYEAGLVKMEDGSFAVVFDHWSAGKGAKKLAQLLGWDGKDCTKLMTQTTRYKIALTAAQKDGHRIKEVETLPGGRLRVVLGIQQPTEELNDGEGLL